MTITPETQISSNYKLKDLLLTNQSLTQPNFPNDAWMQENLVYLADMLEQLSFKLGPFNIISGFRTKELQQKLASIGEPATSKISFHEAGRAVDIYPTTMPLAEYFGKILADEALRSNFSEISIKPEQNSLHLAINVPGDVRTPKVLGLTANNSYAALSASEIQNYIKPYIEEADKMSQEIYDQTTAFLNELNISPRNMFLVSAFAGALLLYYFMLKKPKVA